MDKNSKIYVAGHRGLVGSAIIRSLHSKKLENIVVREQSELDLRDRGAVGAFFSAEKPEYVFLAAAKVGGILANNTYKAEFIHDNLAIALNVIDASYRSGVKKLLNLGSSCIYPKLAPQPLKEEHLLTGLLEPTNEPYAIAKIAAIKLCRYYNEQYGTNFLSAMPTNLFGPGDNFNLETSHVLPAMLRKFHLARLLHEDRLTELRQDIQKRPLGFGIESKTMASDGQVKEALSRLGVTGSALRLWGTGTPRREFLYSDDLADAIVHLMIHCDAGAVGEFVNIGSSSDVSIKDLALSIRTLVGFQGEVEFDASKPDGTPRKTLDISRIKSLGWEPRITLSDGLTRFYEWYRTT